MSVEIWLGFVFASTLILMVPGPTTIFVVSQSLLNGRSVTFSLATGVVAGDLICMSLSFIGLSTLLAVSSTLFTQLKIIGAAYLIWLGISLLRSPIPEHTREITSKTFTSNGLFSKTMAITALNPKGIVFFSAFMPQFINSEEAFLQQFILLATTFLMLALINALFYARLAAKVSTIFKNRKQYLWFKLTGGTTLIGAGIVTATAKYN